MGINGVIFLETIGLIEISWEENADPHAESSSPGQKENRIFFCFVNLLLYFDVFHLVQYRKEY